MFNTDADLNVWSWCTYVHKVHAYQPADQIPSYVLVICLLNVVL